MKADRSRADLVRLLQAPDTQLFGRCAGLLGFEHQPSLSVPLAAAPLLVSAPDMSRPAVESTRPEPQIEVKHAGFLRVVAAKHFDVEDTSTVQATALPGREGSPPREHAPEPLVSWPRLWRRLRPHLCQPTMTDEVDVPALVARLSRAENIATVPRLRRAQFASRPQVVVDRTLRQMPFWTDQDAAATHLARWIARASAEPFPIFDGTSPLESMAVGYPDQRCPDFRGRLVLLLGDLGTYGGSDERSAWLEAGKWLIARGATLRALVPAPWWRVDKRLADLWHAIPWEHAEGRAERLDTCERQSRADQVLTLLSPALRIEPGLLRRARRLLIPGGTDSGTEVDILGHPAVIGYSAVALTLDAKWKKLLEERFDKLDLAIQQEVRGLLHDWHKDLRPEISVEERFCLALRKPDLFGKDEKEKLLQFIRQAAIAIDTQDAKGTLSPAVGCWFRDLETRLTEAIWIDPDVGKELRHACAVVHRNDPDFHPPPGFGPAELQIMGRRKALAPARWRLWQVGQGLVVKPADVSAKGGLPESRPTLGRARVGSAVAEIVAADPRVLVGKPGQPGVPYALAAEAALIPLADDVEHLVLTTDRQKVHLGILDKLDWASRVGRDGFGLWVEFEYEGVAQRMRWIAPGRFPMGSPKDEPERYDDELLHEVELSEGYWLADTACTQDLWVAVMGENPSRFKEGEKGENCRPVERVSWEDCQKFLGRLNEAVPGLDLRLPTEAEWENACRAGTTTPFSFGANVTTEQVNYDGNYPYAGAAKGEYREMTVPVKSLPMNPWGLYEMHGNVWEWCLDELSPYQSGLAVNPLGAGEGEAVRQRVVRGGSWSVLAWYARSAGRNGFGPGDRHIYLGFRVARGRPILQDQPVRAEGAGGPTEASGAQPTTGTRATEVDAKKEAGAKKPKGFIDRWFRKKDQA